MVVILSNISFPADQSGYFHFKLILETNGFLSREFNPDNGGNIFPETSKSAYRDITCERTKISALMISISITYLLVLK
jgi:hypothetical protein